jgi:hypothetical protein
VIKSWYPPMRLSLSHNRGSSRPQRRVSRKNCEPGRKYGLAAVQTTLPHAWLELSVTVLVDAIRAHRAIEGPKELSFACRGKRVVVVALRTVARSAAGR